MVFEDYSGVMCGEANEVKILEEGVDFEIVKDPKSDSSASETESVPDAELGASRNNVNVASENAENEEDRPYVVVRGVIARYYNIIPKNLTTDQGDITVEFAGTYPSEDYENAYIYTGEPIEPSIQVRNHGQLMVPEVDYTIVGYNNNTAISTETRKATVTIRAVDGSNYVGQKTFYSAPD